MPSPATAGTSIETVKLTGVDLQAMLTKCSGPQCRSQDYPLDELMPWHDAAQANEQEQRLHAKAL